MKYRIFILLVGLVFVAAACNNNQVNNQMENSTSPTPPPATTSGPQTVEIKVTSSGFEPATLNLKKGDSVTFTNADSKNHWPAGGAHPIHDADFDHKRALKPGEAYGFTFEKAGEYRFHDHLYASLATTINVTE
jgi:plastocyanin